MEDKTRRIGIFGGTFDPVHNGHISIARSFLESKFIDSLWIFLNPSPPHKNTETTPYKTRLRMLHAAFDPFKEAVISDLEAKLPTPTYTVQTIEHLVNIYPAYQFYLCMGKDSFFSFTSWYHWSQILQYCNLLIADRPAGNKAKINTTIREHAIFVPHNPLDISSTQIREMINENRSIDDVVPLSVQKIIKEEKLYK